MTPLPPPFPPANSPPGPNQWIKDHIDAQIDALLPPAAPRESGVGHPTPPGGPNQWIKDSIDAQIDALLLPEPPHHR